MMYALQSAVECSIAGLRRGGMHPALTEDSARENKKSSPSVDTTGCCDIGMTCLVNMSHLRDWAISMVILPALETSRGVGTEHCKPVSVG
jgi:hypothetical protein